MAKTLTPIAAAPIAAAAVAVTFTTVKAAFPELFSLSIIDAVASTYDKDTAKEVIARSIVGAALEFAMSGNDSRLKSARAALEGKGKGQRVRTMAITAIDAVKASGKARHLAGSDMDTVEAWIVTSTAAGILALTPAPAAPRADKKAPSAPIVTTPAPAIAAAAEGAQATITAPALAPWADAAPSLADVLAAIAANAYSVDEMMAISKALGQACAAMPAVDTAAPIAAAPEASPAPAVTAEIVAPSIPEVIGAFYDAARAADAAKGGAVGGAKGAAKGGAKAKSSKKSAIAA